MAIWTGCSIQPEEFRSMASLTTWGIGGQARWFAEPASLVEADQLLRRAAENSIKTLILGGGSNLLVSDGVLDALVLRLCKGEFRANPQMLDGGKLRLACGSPLALAVAESQKNGLAGLELLAGIPGTVGGAAAMNAGVPQASFGEAISKAETLSGWSIDANSKVVASGKAFAGETALISRAEMAFSYRKSSLAEHIITVVELSLKQGGDPAELAEKSRATLASRKAKQPWGERSAGSVFKNPAGTAAGKLIEEAGCKGWNEGCAVVSQVHANFFLNVDNATCSDMLRLIDRVRDAVRRAHGVELELEVRLWQ